MDVLKDFDKLISDKRIAKIGNHEFDVSLISTRMALKQIVFRDHALTMSGADAFNQAVSIVAEICKPIGGNKFLSLFKKKVTAKWLMGNASYAQLLEFIDFVLAPLYKEAEPVVDKKKVVNPVK